MSINLSEKVQKKVKETSTLVNLQEDEVVEKALEFFIENMDKISPQKLQELSDRKINKIEHELKERIKELNCLYEISNIVEKKDIVLEEILRDVVEIIPSAWQYPEVCCSRIILDGQVFVTKAFQETIWRQSCDLVVNDNICGSIDVYYIKDMPDSDEGPFLNEEKKLLISIAERLGRIAERIKGEQILKESEEKFRAIFENNSAAIAIIQPDTTIAMVNDAYCQMSGYKKDEVIGMSWTKQIPPNDLELLKEYNRRRLLDPKDAPEKYEFTFYKKDGEIRHALMSVSMILSDKKIIASFSDITERKRAEQMLRESENKYKLIFEHAMDGIFEIDKNGGFILVNQKTCEMLGYTKEELYNLTIFETYPAETLATVKERFAQIQLGKGITFERPMKRKDGNIFFVEASTQRLLDGKIQEIIRDITIRKKEEEDRTRLQNLESLGVLAGGIAHDFNNLLAVILGNLSLVLQDLQEEIVKNELLAIKKAALKASVLARQLLTFARGGTPKKSMIAVKNLIKETANLALMDSNVEASFDFKNSLFLEADPGQISQVIQNIVINAKESMPNGGTVNITSEDYQDEENKQYVKIYIRDQGIGIPKEHIHKIMDPYFSTKPKSSEKGSGLGLSVCYSIIKRHEGKIFVNSEINAGTTVTIILPAKQEGQMKKEEEGLKT